MLLLWFTIYLKRRTANRMPKIKLQNLVLRPNMVYRCESWPTTEKRWRYVE